ncbi:hypothetical protein HZH66_015436 [Vespula vulgaris]|uniref:Uncharacterized protein n=1 Tax=Vespula vulgaris TaxID=7454 RepID=A0A834MNZ0_VESVU|nr:hypothetical protein HZH66_015436 [Vespula vulgaris]
MADYSDADGKNNMAIKIGYGSYLFLIKNIFLRHGDANCDSCDCIIKNVLLLEFQIENCLVWRNRCISTSRVCEFNDQSIRNLPEKVNH